jgi:hypothetical protein
MGGRRKWSAPEDEELTQLVKLHGVKGNWHKIATELGTNRTGKQCRER